MTPGIVRRHWKLAAAIIVLTILGVAAIESNEQGAAMASGTARVALPEVDLTRPTAQSVDLDALLEDLTQRPSTRVLRISDARVQVFGTGPDALAAVGKTLEELADGSVREQSAAGIPPDDRLVPRLFIRIPAPAGPDTDAAAEPEFVGTLVLEGPGGRTNPISSVRMGARLLQVIATSDRARVELHSQLGGRSTYSFQLPRRGADGLMDVSITGPDARAALDGFDTVMAYLESALQDRQRQANIPERDQYILEVVDQPLEATPLASGLAPRSIMVIVSGLLLLALCVWLLERRSAGSQSVEPETDTETKTASPPESVTSHPVAMPSTIGRTDGYLR